MLNQHSDFSLSYLGEVLSQVPTESRRRGLVAHKHAVTALSTGESYTYDANGNMITRVEGGQTYTQTFDAENRLISVAVGGQTTSFIYDGDGNLVKKIYPNGSKTLYVGGIYEGLDTASPVDPAVDKASGGSVKPTPSCLSQIRR